MAAFISWIGVIAQPEASSNQHCLHHSCHRFWPNHKPRHRPVPIREGQWLDAFQDEDRDISITFRVCENYLPRILAFGSGKFRTIPTSVLYVYVMCHGCSTLRIDPANISTCRVTYCWYIFNDWSCLNNYFITIQCWNIGRVNSQRWNIIHGVNYQRGYNLMLHRRGAVGR